jgi:hypothetical protein
MTGVNYTKIRHYAPGIQSKQTRLDPDFSAILFKAGVKVTSSTERLIADVSVKAAMPTMGSSAGDSDGKKRGLESASKSSLTNLGGIVFDPQGKKTPGTYLKLHVTEPEKKEALLSADPKPNFGWVKFGETNALTKPKGVTVNVSRQKLDPRTGKPIASTGYDPFDPFAPYMDNGMQVKSLGKTIAESNAGRKLVHFSARAAGVVVDALGKFRCPEGTPAANRFTNERGEGCFAVNLDALKNIATNLAAINSSSSGEKGTYGNLVEILTESGVNVGEIRRIYKESGMSGLAAFASKLASAVTRPHLIGNTRYDNDASYRDVVALKIREAMDTTDTKGAIARMQAVKEERQAKIDKLMTELSVPKTGDEETDMIALLEAIGKSDKYGLLADGHEFQFGGTKKSHTAFLIDNFFDLHEDAIQKYFPDIINRQKLQDQYKIDKDSGVETPLTKAIDAMIEREKQMRIGAFEQIAIDATEDPKSFKETRITVNPAGKTDGDFHVLNGSGGGEDLYIGSGPAIRGYRDAPPDGSVDLYTATGGTQEEQWKAIAAEIHADETGRHWAHTFGTDLAAIMGDGWRSFGTQVAAHEMYHIQQVRAISEYLKFRQSMGDDIDGLTRDRKIEDMGGDELAGLAMAFLTQADPQMLREALGADIEDLIEARLDGVAGRYSGNVQQDALYAIMEGDAREGNYKRSLALLETLADLAANRKVGLIDGSVDKLIEHVIGEKEIIPESFKPPVIPGGTPVPDVPVGPRPAAWKELWWSKDQINVPVPDGRGGGSGGPRGPFDPFSGNRTSDLALKIREGTLTNEDLDELLNGKDKGDKNKDGSPRREGGILKTWRAARNVRKDKDNPQNSKEKQRMLNEALDELPLDEEQLKVMIQKLQNGEVLSQEEEDKLVDSIQKLSARYDQLTEDMEKVQAEYDQGCPDSISARDNAFPNRYDDKSGCESWYEGMEEKIKRLEFVKDRIGRGLRPQINDIWDINEYVKVNGKPPFNLKFTPDPNTPLRSGGMASASRISTLQDSRLSPEEMFIASSAMAEVPSSVMSSIDVPGYLDDVIEINDTFSSYGIEPPAGTSFDDTKTIVPLLSVIDKSIVSEDLIAEFEIDESDYSVGSVIETSGVRKLSTIDSPQNTVGFASTSRGRAAVVGRLLNSKQSRKLMRTMGIDPENEDLVSLAAETALAFSVGGPAGAIIPIARRAGKDSAEKALQMMVSRGWITQSIASKISSHGLDRIAKEGLPEEIIQLMKNLGDSVSSRENKNSALRMATALRERSDEIKETSKRTLKNIKDKVSEMRESSSEELVKVSGPKDARKIIDGNLPAAVKTEKEAYTILTELAKMANEAKAKGTDAPNYDFCKVSIPGTNLFCGDSKGIPRKKMPQFSGEPTPGSPADSRPKNKKGEVDGTDDFIKHMEAKGIKIEERQVLASELRASQNELVGEKVAGMMTNEDFNPAGEPIFVSRDGYVIDGHHRWAAQVGRDLEDGNIGDLPLNVRVVDMDIEEVLDEANKFASEFGIAPKTAGNDAVAVKSVFVNIRFKQLGEPILKQNQKPEEEKSTKKQKVRVVVPKGSKAKVDKSGDILIPPGKMKVTGIDEDGVAEAEITEQMSAVDYMKNAEKQLSEKMKNITDERVKKLISSDINKYKKSKIDKIISSPDNGYSNTSNGVLEKANTIIENASNMGYALFNEKDVYVSGQKIPVTEYYDLFLKSINNIILEIKKDLDNDLFPEDKQLNSFIKSNSESYIYSILEEMSVSLFEKIDRRARISMSRSSLQEFLTSGRIANVDVDSKMLSEMKKNRDTIIGGTVSSTEFSLTPVNLMHESKTRLIEESLYFAGTRVGSEEYADYGRGIEVVLRSENAKRIGYGRFDNEENEGLYSLITDDDKQRIVMTMFGNVVKNSKQAKETILLAIDSYLKKDYDNFLKSDEGDTLEGFIVGEINLNDIEHIKIPVSIFKVTNKPVSPSHPIAGKKRISNIFKKRGMTDSAIKEFFDKGGMIGGGFNPKYLIYLLEIEAAQELKDRLISFGVPEVIFTNKNGIDIMAEKTWFTPAPDSKNGIDALRKLAKMEIDVIMEKTVPKNKENARKEKSLL